MSGRGGGGGRVGGVRVDVNEELKFLGKFKKKWGGVRGVGSGGIGGGAGCRVGGRVWGVRVDVNEELKFLGKFTKKNSWGGGVGSGGGQAGGRAGGGGGQGGYERNVGGRGDVGNGGCEPRIEGIVQCTKRYCTILRK